MGKNGLTLLVIVISLSGCLDNGDGQPVPQDSEMETEEEASPCQPSDVLPVEGPWTLMDPHSAYGQVECGGTGLEGFRIYDATNKGFRLDASQEELDGLTAVDCSFSDNDFACPIAVHETPAGNPNIDIKLVTTMELSGSFWREEAGQIDFSLSMACEGADCDVLFEDTLPCTTTLSGGIRPEPQDDL